MNIQMTSSISIFAKNSNKEGQFYLNYNRIENQIMEFKVIYEGVTYTLFDITLENGLSMHPIPPGIIKKLKELDFLKFHEFEDGWGELKSATIKDLKKNKI